MALKDDIQFQDNDDEFTGPTIDLTSQTIDQEIIGFGGAFTEASSTLFQGLSKENQEKFMEMYYDSEKGIGYTMGRIPIGACDFSPAPAQWSLDDVPNDVDLKHFDTNLTHDKQ